MSIPISQFITPPLAFNLIATCGNLSPFFSPSPFTSFCSRSTPCLLGCCPQGAKFCGENDLIVQVGMARASLPPPSADSPWSLAILSHASLQHDSPSPTVALHLSPISSHLILSLLWPPPVSTDNLPSQFIENVNVVMEGLSVPC